MPFRHVVLLTLVPEVPPGQVEQIVAGMRALPSEIPELRSYVVGIDNISGIGNRHCPLLHTNAMNPPEQFFLELCSIPLWMLLMQISR